MLSASYVEGKREELGLRVEIHCMYSGVQRVQYLLCTSWVQVPGISTSILVLARDLPLLMVKVHPSYDNLQSLRDISSKYTYMSVLALIS